MWPCQRLLGAVFLAGAFFEGPFGLFDAEQSLAAEGGVGGEPDKGSAQSADVRRDVFREKFEQRVIHRVLYESFAAHLVQDREPRLVFRRTQFRDHPLFEPGFKLFVELLDFAGLPIGGEHDLLVPVVKQIENIEEFGLHLFFSGEHLHIVDQQHVNVPHPCPESAQILFFKQIIIELIEHFVAGHETDFDLARIPVQFR